MNLVYKIIANYLITDKIIKNMTKFNKKLIKQNDYIKSIRNKVHKCDNCGEFIYEITYRLPPICQNCFVEYQELFLCNKIKLLPTITPNLIKINNLTYRKCILTLILVLKKYEYVNKIITTKNYYGILEK